MPIIPDQIPFFNLDLKWLAIHRAVRPDMELPMSEKRTITPNFAKQILEERNVTNRPLNRGRVLKYAREIIAGQWKVTHQGLAFDWDGNLFDGQHRLAAIVEAERPVEMMVAFGMDPEAMIAVDEGRPRSTKDVANILGLDINKNSVSATNYLLEIKSLKARASRTDQLHFLERHRDAAEWAADRINRIKFVNAPVLAAVIRAYYNCLGDDAKMNRLHRFCEVYNDGMTEDATEVAAIRLRNYVIQHRPKKGDERKALYRKAISAIRAFINEEQITKLYGLDDDIFKLPEEELGRALL